MSKKVFHRSASSGQSLLEFAISLTFMLILLSGAVDFGIGLFYYVAMRDAAQEGAVYGSLNPDDVDGIGVRVSEASGDGLIAGIYADEKLEVAVAYSGSHCEGNGITVTLTYDYPLSMPFIATFIGRDYIKLRAAVTDTIITPVCS